MLTWPMFATSYLTQGGLDAAKRHEEAAAAARASVAAALAGAVEGLLQCAAQAPEAQGTTVHAPPLSCWQPSRWHNVHRRRLSATRYRPPCRRGTLAYSDGLQTPCFRTW